MATRLIKCVPAQGFAGIWRAKRFWPAAGVLVETTEGDADVEETGKPLKICRTTYDALMADGRFSFGIAGTPDEVDALAAENATLKAHVDEVEAANLSLKDEASRLAGELQKARASNDALAAENATLKAHVDEVEAANLSLKDEASRLAGELQKARASNDALAAENATLKASGVDEKKGGGKK